MKTIQALQAIRQQATVTADQRIEIRDLPFQPGAMVEVIVVEQDGRQQGRKEPEVYGTIEKIKKKREFPRYTLREIENIIHQSRGVSE